MQTAKNYLTHAANNMGQALGYMPIRSSAIARQMIKAALPVPETRSEIEQYVRDLLNAKEQRVCDMATD